MLPHAIRVTKPTGSPAGAERRHEFTTRSGLQDARSREELPTTGTAIAQQLMAGKELGAESSDRNTAHLPPGVHSPAPANLVGFLDAGTSLPGHGFSGTPPTETTGILPTPKPKPNPHFAGIALAGMPTQAIQSSQQSWLSAVAGVSYMRPVSQVNRSRRVYRLCGGLPRQTFRPPSPPFRAA
jgi:hypothetical protein